MEHCKNNLYEQLSALWVSACYYCV